MHSGINKAITEFNCTTRFLANKFRTQLEKAKSENDSQTVVKEQIKLEMLKVARGILAGCIERNTGATVEWIWNDV